MVSAAIAVIVVQEAQYEAGMPPWRAITGSGWGAETRRQT
jgi:hypothetical protein